MLHRGVRGWAVLMVLLHRVRASGSARRFQAAIALVTVAASSRP